MKCVHIEARDIPDAWFQAVYSIFDEGSDYQIDRGSWQGHRRLEYDFVSICIKHPSQRPLIPDMPPGMSIPPPTDMEYVQQYLEKLITDAKSENEIYTYGEDLAVQIPKVIKMYREQGPNTNQAYMAVGSAKTLDYDDPPCLRGVDTRIRDGKLHFILYFRSWDLWAGLPSNLAALQMVKEDMAQEIGVDDGEIIASSKGLHLYDYTWELAALRTGRPLPDQLQEGLTPCV
ncbi:MAG: thymidylate synthase [Candidatus Alcyoniella australis]|nr:thymidylate synthase [Candidatus Alcyoniella australis]